MVMVENHSVTITLAVWGGVYAIAILIAACFHDAATRCWQLPVITSRITKNQSGNRYTDNT